MLILANVVINVASMEAMQLMESSRYDFNEPIFIIYTHHSVCAVCLPFGLYLLRSQGVTLREALQEVGMSGDYREFAVKIIVLMLLYKYNILWTLSMTRVSVTLFNAINNSAFVFVLGFSMCLLNEKLSFLKGAAVLIATIGVGLVILYKSKAGQKAHPTTFIGLLYCFTCTLGQAFYTVIYKIWVGNKGPRPLPIMLVTLGLMGVSTFVLFWPVVLGANALGMESGALPDSQQVVRLTLTLTLTLTQFQCH